MSPQAATDQLLDKLATININGYPIAYVARGTGPSVVFVHGTLGDFRSWTPQLDALGEVFRVIAVSLRHCFPERWNGDGGGFSIEQHALDTAAFIDRVGAPVDLVGFSRGGAVVMEVARMRPALLRSLVLIDPGLDSLLGEEGAPDGDPVNRAASQAIKHFKSGDIDAGLQHVIDFANGPGTWEKRSEALKQRMRDNAWTLAGQAVDIRRSVSRADLERLGMPVLLFQGELSTERHKAIMNVVRQCLPSAHFVRIVGAGHTMSATHSAVFNEALTEFLSSRNACR